MAKTRQIRCPQCWSENVALVRHDSTERRCGDCGVTVGYKFSVIAWKHKAVFDHTEELPKRFLGIFRQFRNIYRTELDGYWVILRG